MEGSTQWQCPGSCHHTRNYLSLRQKDSAKHSIFIEAIVALKKGAGCANSESKPHWWTLEVFNSYVQGEGMGVFRGLWSWGWDGGEVSAAQLISIPPLQRVAWWSGRQSASKLRCRSTWLPTPAETGFHLSQLFLTPGNWEARAMSWEASV